MQIKTFLSNMRILFTPRQYTNKSVLRIRVTIDGKRSTDVSTEIFFTAADCWNSRKQTFENSDLLNERVRREKHKIEAIFLKLKEPTAKAIMDCYCGKTTPQKASTKHYNNEISKHLSEEMMLKIEATEFKPKSLQRCADIFIILQRTGINYSDYLRLRIDFAPLIKTYEGTKYIEIHRSKTNQRAIIPVHSSLKKVLEKYNYIPPNQSRSFFYRMLKMLAEKVGIEDKRFSLKWGRKSLTNLFLEKGVSVEATARVLGHAGTEMVQKHYARINEKRVIAEVGKMMG